jgi:hypothetical protein
MSDFLYVYLETEGNKQILKLTIGCRMKKNTHIYVYIYNPKYKLTYVHILHEQNKK